MAAEISSDVDSEAPAETRIQVGVSRKKSQLRDDVEMTWIRRRRPADTKKQVGVSSVATEG